MAEEEGVERDVGAAVAACPPGLTGRPFGPVGTLLFSEVEGAEALDREGPVGRDDDGEAAVVDVERVEGFAGMVDFEVAEGFDEGAGEVAGVGEFETRGCEGARDEAAEGAFTQCFLRCIMTA
jgi:hypothetical protein